MSPRFHPDDNSLNSETVSQLPVKLFLYVLAWPWCLFAATEQRLGKMEFRTCCSQAFPKNDLVEIYMGGSEQGGVE